MIFTSTKAAAKAMRSHGAPSVKREDQAFLMAFKSLRSARFCLVLEAPSALSSSEGSVGTPEQK